MVRENVNFIVGGNYGIEDTLLGESYSTRLIPPDFIQITHNGMGPTQFKKLHK